MPHHLGLYCLPKYPFRGFCFPKDQIFRIIPGFRALGQADFRKSSLKILNPADYNCVSDLFTAYLKSIDHVPHL